MNIIPSFFSQDNNLDSFYMEVRDNLSLKEARDFIEELWQKYAPYAEPDFLEDAKRHFHEKSWEMYLACVFLNHGFQLNKKKNKEGPDICLLGQTKPIWVEAIASGSGTRDDAVPEPDLSSVSDVPEEKILLRLTSAITEKHRKYQNYIQNKIISENDPYIIAINSSKVSRAMKGRDDVPHIVCSVLPFGHKALSINNNGKIIRANYEYRKGIKKYSGTEISTNIFQNPIYKGISAVIYSHVNIVDRPLKIGSEIIYVHNPISDNSDNALPKGLFQFGTEYWVENDTLRNKKWS